MKLSPPSAPDLMPSFSAVLLAGGKSERMGRDKALLPMPHSDELLWQRQLRILGELRAERVFWSGPPRPGIPTSVELVPDTVTSAGLVVLAVDLPRMDAGYLAKLTRRCTPTRGAVPQRGEDFEPLAAVYPAMLRELAEDRLHQGRYAMHDFVREAIRRELIDAIPVAARDAAKFANINSPEDFAKLDGHSK
jgi:molybdopterin-guanine dinucleotide biosynthesis protein A